MDFLANSLNHLSIPENVLSYLKVEDGSLQVKRTAIGKTNLLTGQTVTPVSPAVINQSANTVDMEMFTGSFIEAGVGEAQVVVINLAALEIINRFFIAFYSTPEDLINTFKLEFSEDNINWYPPSYDDTNPEMDLYVNINNLYGIESQYIRLTFSGSASEALKTCVLEAQAWSAEYHSHHVDTEEEIYLWFDFETYLRSDSVVSFVEDATVTASKIKYQIKINNNNWYYDTVATQWTQVTDSPMFWEKESNLATELTNPIMAALPTNSIISLIGVRTLFFPTATETPKLVKVTLTT